MPSNVAHTGLAKDLAEREDSGNPIRVGVVGAGEMGTDLVTQMAHMQGIEIGVISSRNVENAKKAVDIAYGEPDRAVEAHSESDVSRILEIGKIPVTGDSSLTIGCGEIDVVIDATGIPAVGAEIGLQAIQNGKHLVMMNVEADVTIGPYLKAQADKQGVVYSLGAGDEPSSCMELIEFVSALGYPIACAGKGKNNPLNFDAVPDDYRAEADARNMNVRLLVEFVDGSKTMVEMAAIANATGLVPDKPGMHGPSASVDELSSTLIPQSAGGVLSKMGCVDFSIGKGVSPGVFVVADMSHARISERMEDLKIGKGPYFTFHRPYHLTSLEVPLTCAKVVLYGKSDMVPLAKPVAEVCAVAKKDLKPGDTLDAIGEYCYRSWVMTVPEAQSAKAIPCGLLSGATVTAPLSKGGLITSDNVSLPANSALIEMRKRQDAIIFDN